MPNTTPTPDELAHLIISHSGVKVTVNGEEVTPSELVDLLGIAEQVEAAGWQYIDGQWVP